MTTLSGKAKISIDEFKQAPSRTRTNGRPLEKEPSRLKLRLSLIMEI